MRGTRLGVSASALALVLTGCVNLAPADERPPLSVPGAYELTYRPNGEVVAATLSYRQFFVDPRLNTLIGTALSNNRDLVAATARIAQARAQYQIQTSQRLPTIAATGNVTRSRFPTGSAGFAGTPGTGVPGTGGTGGATTGEGAITTNQFQVGVGVSAFELDFWGRVANLSAAARAQYLASVAAQRSFYLSLIADVATTYYELVETQEQIELAQATAESRREGLRLAKRRLDAGVDSALPYYQAETLLTQAEQQLATEQLSAAQLRNQLLVLVGGKAPAELPPSLTLEQQENQLRLDAGLSSDLLLRRPDIVQAEENLTAARANIGAARAAFFPSISLTGRAGLTSNSLDGLFDTGKFFYSIGPSIDLPIFDWGRREGQLDLARAQETEQVATYERAIQTAFREVSDGLAGREYIARQVAVQEQAVRAQEDTARIARLRYREGVTDYLQVLDAERNLFSARQQLLMTRRAYLQNQANLFVALGGGFESGGAEIPSTATVPVRADSSQ
ncbi:efflux transporter outer membrane subunit [Erythrobacter sp. LQ02-29]|uniref:efflux transporter outer membrane subunit n=1 Tax=Erythrobacter sp. LQ02-29 TaxID=2920384 RepID=UPI001F4F0D79|nr:efflux transporter outer membrane subunit [Erythrobacter sp. LQ02-29]